MKTRIFISVLMLLLWVQLSQAQEDMNTTVKKLADKIEKVVKQKESRWKLIMKDVSTTDEKLKSLYFSWKPDNKSGYVNVKAYVYISSETADRSFHNGLKTTSGGVKAKLEDLGDEAVIVMYGGGKNDVSVVITILKENTEVIIAASDKKTGMRFAKRMRVSERLCKWQNKLLKRKESILCHLQQNYLTNY